MTNFAKEQLKSLMDRVLRLKAEQDTLSADIKEIYAEAKRIGIDPTILGLHVKRERQISKGFYVYVAAFGAHKSIKIGISRDVSKRLEDLKAAGNGTGTLLFSSPGTFQDEGMLHLAFGAFRQSGEWFARNDESMSLVETLKENGLTKFIEIALLGSHGSVRHD